MEYDKYALQKLRRYFHIGLYENGNQNGILPKQGMPVIPNENTSKTSNVDGASMKGPKRKITPVPTSPPPTSLFSGYTQVFSYCIDKLYSG